jgi:murein DD-endopeptidase MepM/ murein hydrolase activator NlpD
MGSQRKGNDVHIILVSEQLATAKSINLGWRHLAVSVACFFALVIATASLFSYITVRHAAEIRLPFLENLLSTMNAAETQRSQEFVRENLNAMAVKLGQMQAQLVRLDSLGERLSTLSGLKPAERREATDAIKDGRGGPLIQPTPMSTTDLQAMLDDLSRQLDVRGDNLSMIESQLLDERLRKSMLPTTLPVATQWISSFGWRIDPITGERAMHEGVDFPADVGTQVIAAAAGVVVSADRHPEYGNILEIDHGNELSTRYAHLSKILVKPGSVVKRGQPIAQVGNTGRSTGPHLHFEVRLNGQAQNPARFLAQASASGGDKFSLATHQ